MHSDGGHLQMKCRTFAFVAGLLICSIALSGCSDPKAKAVGTYELDKEAIRAAAAAEVKAKGEHDPSAAGAEMMLGIVDQMAMVITLNADGSATMQTAMIGQTSTASGTWTISGTTISITGAPPGQERVTLAGTIVGDTITLKPASQNDLPYDLVFKKKKKA